jgi:hypothetical protein
MLLALLTAFRFVRGEEPEFTAPFQSYRIDAIGQVARSWRLGTLGADTTEAYHNKKMQHLYHGAHPFYFTSPYWFLFIGHNFNAIPSINLIFNWTDRISIEPRALYFRTLTVMTMRSFECIIKNTMPNEKLIIGQVSAFSRAVYFLETAPSTLLPGESYKLSGYLCPLAAGSSSAIVLIWTNFGVIPYSISYVAVETQVQIGVSRLYHQNNPTNSTLHVFIPREEKERLAFYDSGLMQVSAPTSSDDLELRAVWPLGFHVTFITLNWHAFTRIVPIFLMSSVKLIQPILPVFIVPTVTNADERGECEIIVENPTPSWVDCSSISLAGIAPPNVFLETPRSRVRIGPTSYYFLGKVVITAAKPGPVQVTVVAETQSSDTTRQVIEIPVRGYVAVGTIVPSVSAITILESIARDFNFSFRNGFHDTLAVFAVRCTTGGFEFPKFRPFVVGPGQESKAIQIVSALPSTKQALHDSLILETNITRFTFPLRAYSGHITISDSETMTGLEKDKLALSLPARQVLVNSYLNLSIWIHNLNPASFASAADKWSFKGIAAVSPINFTISEFTSQRVFIPIQFPDGRSRREQSGEIHFGFVNSSVDFEISFSWIPVFGKLKLTSSLPEKIVYGMDYKPELYIDSTYSTTSRITDVSLQTGTSQCVDLPLPTSQKVFLGDPLLSVSEGFLRHYLVLNAPLVPDRTAWQTQAKGWDSWRAPVPIGIDVTISLNNGFFLKSSLNAQFVHSTIDDMFYDFGEVTINSTHQASIFMRNSLNTPISYAVVMPDAVESELRLVNDDAGVVPPDADLNLSFAFSPMELGSKQIHIPVLTNVTPPFFVDLASEVLPCEFAFMSDDAELLENASLADIQSLQFTYSLYLKNSGKIEIPVYEVRTTSPGIVQIWSNASSTLRSGEVAEIRLDVSARRFANRSHFFELVAATCAGEKALGIQLVLGDTAFRSVQWQQRRDFMLIVMLGLLPLVPAALCPVVGCCKTRIKVRRRLARLAREIGMLSVSKWSSIGLQVDPQRSNEVVNSGKWVKSSATTPPVTKSGLEAMLVKLNTIK